MTTHLTLFYGGNGTTPVDSGWPDIGVFYGVTLDGHLEWNCYLGTGAEAADARISADWASNSGNLIGQGWGALNHLQGCGDGVIIGIDKDGYLRWYRYMGQGESDPKGDINWHPNSGNRVGNGFGPDNFSDIFVMPAEGRSATIQIFCVTHQGDLVWYGYIGAGADNPGGGGSDWHPNSGGLAGIHSLESWQGYAHLHGSGTVIFGTTEDGLMTWHTYSDGGEEKDVARPIPGSRIGNGWQSLRCICGGVTNGGHAMWAINDRNELVWYGYNGTGTSDPTGALGWRPNSGNRIDGSW